MPGEFDAKCYELLCQVPKGKVTTYKLLAEAMGSKAYRAVGMAMNRNPNAPEVPCHRVVASNGNMQGYAYGIAKKVALLEAEGVPVTNDKVIHLNSHLHRF